MRNAAPYHRLGENARLPSKFSRHVCAYVSAQQNLAVRLVAKVDLEQRLAMARQPR